MGLLLVACRSQKKKEKRKEILRKPTFNSYNIYKNIVNSIRNPTSNFCSIYDTNRCGVPYRFPLCYVHLNVRFRLNLYFCAFGCTYLIPSPLIFRDVFFSFPKVTHITYYSHQGSLEIENVGSISVFFPNALNVFFSIQSVPSTANSSLALWLIVDWTLAAG